MPNKTKVILGLAILLLVVLVGWPIASCELSYFELCTDLCDIASQNSVRIGLAPASTDEEIRATWSATPGTTTFSLSLSK